MGRATHVYANNNEIASKSATGKSAMAFPDVCFSPPTPPPSGVPIPYPNTCYAKHISNGSRSVFIRRKEIALEDKSYFKTSTGDEPATPALKKGIISSKIKGKCYFQMWSPNVKVEGLGVDRHLDIVTHNHRNQPNALLQKYKARDTMPSQCARDKKRINEKCGPDDEKTKARQRKRGIKGKDNPPQDPAKYNWIPEHCGPLLMTPGLANFDKFKETTNFLSDGNYDDLVGKLMEEAAEEFEQKLADYAKEKAAKYAIRRVATGWIPLVGQIIAVADTLYTAYEVATTIPDRLDQLDDLKKMADRARAEADKLGGIFDKYKDRLKNWDNLIPQEKEKIAKEIMTATQTAYASVQPCISARKCQLQPYSDTTKTNPLDQDGCCPGQTGHHLLPDAMFRDPATAARDKAFNAWKGTYSGEIPKDKLKMKHMPRDKLPKEKCWENYSEAAGPTICAEGGNPGIGSHALIHKATTLALEPQRGQRTMSYATARDRVSEIIAEMYGCQKECIAAQLDQAYSKMNTCGPIENAKVVPHSGKSGDTKCAANGVDPDCDGEI